MHSPDFDYAAPESLSEAFRLLSGGEDTLPLAGGQSLLQSANLGELRPSRLVDLGRLAELQGIEANEEHLRIGAGVPMSEIAQHDEVKRLAAPLVRTLGTVGSEAIRNRATLGGSIAWADPTSQLPAMLLALGAELDIRGPKEGRHVKVKKLFGPRTNGSSRIVQPDELIVAVYLPIRPHRTHGLRLVRRTSITWPVAGCAAVVDDEKVCLGLFGAAERPLLVESLSAVEERIDPFTDGRATAGYRRTVLPVLARRALDEAGQP